MKAYFRNIMAAVVTGGLLVMGLLVGGFASASASGLTHVDVCSNSGGTANTVTCSGVLNGNTTTVTIGNVNVLSGNELNLLTINENTLWTSVANNPDIQLQVNDIASGTVVILHDVLNISVCQVKVGELGFINNNLALCH